ncbi:MAG: glycerol-3-phosphate 1-O-acyltransferase PlsY [Polaromonas sp.]|nr:glycerol-3-phosphate 1-O-acyltransferase PlsY [Polaromonas sp.]
MDYVYPIGAVLAAYLIGSLSFAVIVSKLMGLEDPRGYGSKNPGATNVLRSGNKVAAAATLLLDACKGGLPMALVLWFGKDHGLREGTLAAVGLAAFIGHLYPVFFRFQGGKGVATAAGVLFGIHWVLGLATLTTWVIVAFFSRYSSLAAIACAIFAPWYYLIGDRAFWYVDKTMVLALFVMSAFLILRHRENINKLLQGKESKLGGGKG